MGTDSERCKICIACLEEHECRHGSKADFIGAAIDLFSEFVEKGLPWENVVLSYDLKAKCLVDDRFRYSLCTHCAYVLEHVALSENGAEVAVKYGWEP